MPPAVPGRCRFCGDPIEGRRDAHPECKQEWRTWNVPAEVRLAVFERDGYRCVDCREIHPESQLQPDHDVELVDGGRNDPSNYVTRCTRCHQVKTTARARARRANAPTNRGATAMPASAVARPKPTASDALRAAGGGAWFAGLFAALGWLAARVYPPAGAAVRWGIVLGVAWVVGVGLWHKHRLDRWRREQRAQQVYERCCQVTKDAAALRSERFRVDEWRDGMPARVRLTVGGRFDAQDPRAVAALRAAYASAVGVPVTRTTATPGRDRRGPLVQMVVLGDDDPDAPGDAAGALEVAGEEQAAAPETPVEVRLAAALSPVVDPEVRVLVTAKHDDGHPADLVVVYPPRATARIAGELASIRDTVSRAYPPRQDEWALAWDAGRDRLLLTDSPDPLAPIVSLPPIEADPDLTEGVRIGTTESGQAWRVPLLGGYHWLVAGASGAGKGSVLWGIVRGLERMIADGRVRLWIVDPKGGAEFTWAQDFAYRFAVAPNHCEEVLEEVRNVMLQKASRNAAAKRRKVERVTADEPLDLVIVDELANVTAYVDPTVGKKVAAHLAALCSMGRSAAVTVVAAVQDPRKEVVKNRGLFTGQIALRMNEAAETNLILGPGARAAGATADLIPKAHPGIAYMLLDGRAGHVRARAAFVSDSEIEEIANRLATPALPPAATAPEHGPAVTVTAVPTLPDESDDDEGKPTPAWKLKEGDRFRFDPDPDVVVLVSKERDPDEPDDRLVLTFHYEDEDLHRETNVDRGEFVNVL